MKTSAIPFGKRSFRKLVSLILVIIAGTTISLAQDKITYSLQPNTIALGSVKTFDLYLTASDKSALDTVTVEAPEGWGVKIKGKPSLANDKTVMIVTVELDETAEPGEVQLRVKKSGQTTTLVLNLIKRKPLRPDTEGGAYAFVTLMDPNNVADIFGSRIAHRYIALQVTIENYNDKLDYLIRDVSLDLNKVFPAQDPAASLRTKGTGQATQPDDVKGWEKRMGPPLNASGNQDSATGEGFELSKYRFRLSSMELSLVRGIAEKGQGQSTRNLLLRLLRATGTIAASFIGVTPVGRSYAPAAAMFNGPMLTSYSDAFPDYTINQLNRLNDSAYRANTLVPKGMSKVLVVFIDQADFLTDQQRSMFKKDPILLAFSANGQIDFRRAEAIVHGSLIEEVNNQPPSITTARFDSDSVANFQNAKPVVKGRIIGKYLADSDIKFADDTKDLSVVKDGSATDNELKFLIKADKPVKPGRELSFEVSNAKGRQVQSLQISYTPASPVITKVEPTAEGVQEAEVELKLTGTFFPEDLQPSSVTFDPPAGIQITKVTPDKDSPSTSITVNLKIDKSAEPGDRQMRIGDSEPKKFVVKKKG